MLSTAMSQHLDPHCGNHEYDLRSIFSFATHYEGNKEPYILVLDPVWVKTDYKLEGTIQFVDYLRAAFNVSDVKGPLLSDFLSVTSQLRF